MAISKSALETVIKSGRDDLLRDLMRTELKRLRDTKRYYSQKASQLPSDVDYDTFVKIKAKQNLLDEQINQLVKARKNLKTKHTKATAQMLDVAKQQKVFTTDSKAFTEYSRSFDENINNTFNSMFGKGQFIMSDTEMTKFDKIFNKYGIGITDTIKKNIANRYKYWSSDLAYQIISEWISKAEAQLDSVSESDKKEFNNYLNTIKGRI